MARTGVLGPPNEHSLYLSSGRLHEDETTVPILRKGKTETGRIWTYVRDDRPLGGKDPPLALLLRLTQSLGQTSRATSQ
jgi:hypothetical protein